MQQNPKQFSFVVLTAVFDTLALVGAYLSAFLLRFYSGLIPKDGVPELEAYLKALVIVVPVHLAFFRAYGLYDIHRHRRRVEELFTMLKAVSFAVVVLTAATFFYRAFSYSRVHLSVAWFISILFVGTSRYFLIQWEYHRKVNKKQITRVLLIGTNRNARNIIEWAKNNAHYGNEIIGVFAKDNALIGKHIEGVPVLGMTEQCEDFILKAKPDYVILADPTFSRDQITDLAAVCEDQWIEFKVVADIYGLMTRRVDVEYVSQVPLLGFRSLPLDDIWNRFAKRFFDIMMSLFFMAAASPVWLLAMALIYSDDKGPVFYEQERVGRDQRTFKLLKFRTMRVNAESETGPVWAKPDDDRRTKIGNSMRRWNLDELPQLWNVFKGEMSLVGPRPERPHFVGQFREEIPRYMARHKIKSGLTGWAQVNGFRGDTSIQERLKYDLYYMENWSILFDIEILFMTFSKRAFKNAY